MSHSQRILPTLLLLAMNASLPGCFRSPDVALWTLSPDLSACVGATAAEDALSLRIEPIRFPKYLDDPRMTRRTGAHQIARDEFNRWAEELGDLFTHALIRDLACRLRSATVFSAREYPQRTAQRFLTLSVEQFEPSHSGYANLVAVWGVASSPTAIATTPLHRLTLSTRSTDDSPNAHAAALSALINGLADYLAPVVSAP